MPKLKKTLKRKPKPHVKTKPTSHKLSIASVIVILCIGVMGILVVKYKPHERLFNLATQAVHSISKRLDLTTKKIIVEGIQYLNEQDVLLAAQIPLNTPLYKVDISIVFQRLSKLSWVKTVSVQRRWPQTIFIKITERTPMALWQFHKKLYLVDTDGQVITNINLQKFHFLPHVMGAKAPQNATNILRLLNTYPELSQRVTSRIFIDERRWDLILDKKIRVRLPEKQAEKALAHLESMRKKGHINSESVVSIDLRIEDRTYFELTPEALAKQLKAGEKPL